MTIETHNWSSSAHQELHKIVRNENFPIVNQVDARVLELEIKCLLKAVVSQDILSVVQNESVVDTSDLQTKLEHTKECFKNCIIKKENEYAKLWNDWYKKCDECKYDKISYDKAYKDMQQKIEQLQAQLGDLKGKSKDTSCVSYTRNPLSQKLESELDLLFEAMYDDYIGGQPSAYVENVLTAHESQDVDELNPNAMVNGNTFVNPFANSSTRAAESSSLQNVDPSNMHTFYQPAWIESMQEELLQFKRMDVWVLVPAPDNISPLTLKWIFKNKHDEEQTNHFFKGTVDLKLFIRRFDDEILVSKYVLEILKKYGIESCDPVGTPMEIKDKLDLYQNGTPVDAMKYRSMIGALMYLTSSRPNIIHATCLCARYQAKPTEKHLKEVKRIFRYLWGTVNTGLWYTKDFGFELTGFSDADYARCKDTFKSTSGRAQFLGEKLVSWSSKK
nr:uncharacterized mitochondrial protein AtMg00810-like [Tanacetum cinerariifolium]